MMQMRQEYPKRVKVNVVDNEKLPSRIDLEKDIRRDVSAAAATSAGAGNDWQEKYLRLAADLDNSKKRLAQTYKRQAEQEKERLLGDFLEVADNLERALAHTDSDASTLEAGVKSTQRQFQQILTKHEVRPFAAAGQPFDPQWHEAVSVINRPDLPPNTVAQVVQTGYTIGDRLLRPARVVVTAA